MRNLHRVILVLSLVFSAGVFLGAFAAPSTTLAHASAEAKNTRKQCEKIKNNKKKDDCLKCVTKMNHHFHPSEPPAKRCHKKGD